MGVVRNNNNYLIKRLTCVSISVLLATSLAVVLLTFSSSFNTVSASPSVFPENFTIVALPDTQYYSQSYPWIFENQTEWIVQNENEDNIVFVTHLGDIVDTYYLSSQWENANNAMSILDNKVPYTVLPGNHDMPGNLSATNYEIYFPASRYEDYYYWGGSYDPSYANSPSPNMNNYQLFTWGGMNFITLSLQYDPPSDVLSWADSVLDNYPNRRAIISTHSYLNPDNTLTSNGGNNIWSSVVVPENNVFLVLCGHTYNSGIMAEKIDNLGGRVVYQLLSDYQDLSSGGNGWLRIMKFAPSDNKIYVKTYSPYLNSYMTDPTNQFTLSYPMAVAVGVSVSISPASQVRLHGSTLDYAVKVTNLGIENDNYVLTVTDNGNWAPTLLDNLLRILAGRSSGTTLSVTIPENAAYGTIDNITVTARSSENENVWDSASCVARSATVSCKLSINPSFSANKPGENTAFTVWVKNTSDDNVFRDNYTLVASDSLGWQLSIDNIENVLAGENVGKTLTVAIPENAIIGTNDNILVTAISSENANVRDNGLCVASAVIFTGTASLRLVTSQMTAPFLYGIYKAYVNVNLLVSGDNLHLKFLKYDNKTVENDIVIWSRTTPGVGNVILENLIVPHDNQYPIYSPPDYVKRVKLVLTDNSGAIILDNMAWYKVIQDDWGDRISWIVLNWTLHTPSSQDKLGDEISTIVLNWALIPSGPRDQHDFSQS